MLYQSAMNARNRAALADRVVRAAEESLAGQGYAAPIDVLVGIGWLSSSAVQRWRQGQIDFLEREVQANLSRVSEAMHCFQSWATKKGLHPSETRYVARAPTRPALRFSKSGQPSVERQYCTHWVSPELSDKRRQKLAEKANRAPELVVVQPLNPEWKCHRCDGSGGLLIMEAPGPACLSCAGLGDLQFLPAGDASLTRRVKKESARFAVVVRFSRTRKRYERQGLLVEANALDLARRDGNDDPHV